MEQLLTVNQTAEKLGMSHQEVGVSAVPDHQERLTRIVELTRLVTEAAAEPSVVYFAVREDGRPGVKIGVTRQLRERMRALRCRPIATISGDAALEDAFHRFFEADRIVGEWFRETMEMREFLETCWTVGRLRWL